MTVKSNVGPLCDAPLQLTGYYCITSILVSALCPLLLCPCPLPLYIRASSAALMTGRLRSLADLPWLPETDERAALAVPLATLSATLVSVGVWQSMLV